MFKQIKPCYKCKQISGFKTRRTVVTIYEYDPNGKLIDENTEIKHGRYQYCAQCDANISNCVKITDVNGEVLHPE